MNRSFQSIATLVVSLSGAMLAVMWLPAEAPRPVPQRADDRKRAVAITCGFVAGHQEAAAVVLHRSSGGKDGGDPAAQFSLWTALPPDLSALLDRGTLPSADSVPALPALRSAALALGSGLSPLWPLRQSPSSRGDALNAENRQSIEAQYAAAELAAAAPPAGRWVSSGWRSGADAVGSGLNAACESAAWTKISATIKEEVVSKYQQMITDIGWEQVVPPLADHVRRQHNRLVLREQLLLEFDRRFMEMPLDQFRLPPKPEFRGRSRKLMLATADALRSLSESLAAAAQRLEEASRQDVAELHSPSENREEKR